MAIAHKEPNRVDFENNFGTATPKPEVLRDVEAGYAWNNNIAAIQANVYYMNYKNQLVQTGMLNDVGAYIRTNIPKSYRMGISKRKCKTGQYRERGRQCSFEPEQSTGLSCRYLRRRLCAPHTQVFNKTDISFSPFFRMWVNVNRETG